MNERMHGYVHGVLAALLLAVVSLGTTACGGGGSATVDLDAAGTGSGYQASDTGRSTGRLVTEEEIATLPAWQQELLSDPGWNQPYIEPRAATPIEPPTYEELIAATREALEAGVRLEPRQYSFGTKSASWTDQQGFAGETLIKGEYPAEAIETPGPHGLRDGIPYYGCNNDGTNESVTGNALEDLISQKPMPLQRISYVFEGQSLTNFFNETGGSGNDMLSAVYQLFSDNRAVDPVDLEPV